MKVVCICFGGYKEVFVRSSPFVKDNNIVGSLPSHSTIEIEHCVYNDNWFKIKDQESYIVMWLRSDIGLIDYQIDRGCLKMFRREIVPDVITVPEKDIAIKEITKNVSNLTIEVENPKPKRSGGRAKKERIPATVRNIVWVSHFQASKKGQCWLCKVEDISSANFECGHVISEKNGGKPTIDNLRPICGFCNKSVGTMNMEDFKRKYNIP